MLLEGFTKRYNITKLVYFKYTDDVTAAITREKQIKGLLRSKKVQLIKTMNPKWDDLSEAWFAPEINEQKSPPPRILRPPMDKRVIGGLQNDRLR